MTATPCDLLGSSSRKANWRRWTRSRPDSNFSSLVIFHHFVIFYLFFTSLRLSWRWCCMTLVSRQTPWNSRRWPSTSSGPTYLPLKLTEITIDMSTPSILRYFHLLIISIIIALLVSSILLIRQQLKQEKYSSSPKSIRTKDPDNHSDTETGTLSIYHRPHVNENLQGCDQIQFPDNRVLAVKLWALAQTQLWPAEKIMIGGKTLQIV